MTDGKKRKPLLNCEETAAALGCHVETLRRHLKAGNCPVPPVPNMKPPKWKRIDIEAFTGEPVA